MRNADRRATRNSNHEPNSENTRMNCKKQLRSMLPYSFFVLLSAVAPGLAQPPKVGAPIPEFRVAVLDKSVSLTQADMKDKTVIIEFWAPWSVPCRLDRIRLLELQRLFGSKGLRILAVT